MEFLNVIFPWDMANFFGILSQFLGLEMALSCFVHLFLGAPTYYIPKTLGRMMHHQIWRNDGWLVDNLVVGVHQNWIQKPWPTSQN